MSVTPQALLQTWQYGVEVEFAGQDPLVYHVTPVKVNVGPEGRAQWAPVVIQRVFSEEADGNNPWEAWLREGSRVPPRHVYLTWYTRQGTPARKFRLTRARLERYDAVPEASAKSSRIARQTIILSYDNAVELPLG